jgi:hypothetical protein
MMMRRGLTGTVGRQAQRKLLGTAVTKTAKSASKSTKKGLKFKMGRVAKKPKVAKTSVKKKQAQLAIKGPNRKAIAGPKLSKSYPVATRKTNYPVSVYKPRTSTTVTRTTSAGKSWRQRFKMGPAMKRKIRNALITGAVSGTAGAGVEIGMMYAYHRAMGHSSPTAKDMGKVAADAGTQIASRAASGETVTPTMIVEEGKKAFKRRLDDIKRHSKSTSKDPVSLTKKQVSQILQDAARMQLRTNLNARLKYLQLYKTDSRGKRHHTLHHSPMYGSGSGKKSKRGSGKKSKKKKKKKGKKKSKKTKKSASKRTKKMTMSSMTAAARRARKAKSDLFTRL